MFLGQDQDDLVGKQRSRPEMAALGRGGHQGHIQLALFDQGQEILRIAGPDHDLDRAFPPAVFPEQWRQAKSDVGIARSQDQSAPAFGAELGQRGPPAFGQTNQRPGIVQQHVTGRGRPHAPAGPAQESHAQFTFEGADLLTDRGLGQMQSQGRPAETGLLNYLYEGLELVEFHAAAPPPFPSCAKRRSGASGKGARLSGQDVGRRPAMRCIYKYELIETIKEIDWLYA